MFDKSEYDRLVINCNISTMLIEKEADNPAVTQQRRVHLRNLSQRLTRIRESIEIYQKRQGTKV